MIYLKVINSFIHKFEGGEWIAVLGLMIFAQMEVVGGLSFVPIKLSRFCNQIDMADFNKQPNIYVVDFYVDMMHQLHMVDGKVII